MAKYVKVHSQIQSEINLSFYRNYIVFIILPVIVTGLAAIGITRLEREDRFLETWLPRDNYYRLNSGKCQTFLASLQGSDLFQFSEWLSEMRASSPGWGGGLTRSYPRSNQVIVRSTTVDNPKSVLSYNLLKKLILLRSQLISFSRPPSKSLWEECCFRVTTGLIIVFMNWKFAIFIISTQNDSAAATGYYTLGMQ